MLLGILMAFNFSVLSLLADTAVPSTISVWKYTASTPAASGVLAPRAILMSFNGTTAIYNTSGLSTKGYKNLTLMSNNNPLAMASRASIDFYSNVDSNTDITPSNVNAVLANGKVTLSCVDDRAFIMYSINEGEYKEYSPSEKIMLGTSPICIKAYAEVDGQSGDITTFNYIQGLFIKELIE